MIPSVEEQAASRIAGLISGDGPTAESQRERAEQEGRTDSDLICDALRRYLHAS